MSTPMYEIPEHFPMPVNAAGEGPETDDLKVVRTVCWSCSEDDWPCKESTRIANAPRLVYYSSVTNNTHRFMEKLGQKSLRLPLLTSEDTPVMTEPFVFVTPTYGGQGDKNAVPKQVIKFLNVESNRNLLRGVIGSGNINFGEEYCRAADIIAAKCGVPRLYRFELMGTPEDVAKVTKGLEVFWS